MLNIQSPNYKWSILALITLTGTLVVAAPASCMPALFEEISQDLGLTLVQIGIIWGMASLPGVFFSIIGGLLSDRFGIRRILMVLCLLAGITGALRGISNSFLTLALIVFMNGVVRMMIPITIAKAVGTWFRGPKLGMAMGVMTMGMGLGLTIGPMISATLLSPLLGGWRHVLYFYGLIAVLMGLTWAFFGREPVVPFPIPGGPPRAVAFRAALSKLVHVRAIWLISFCLMLRTGCAMGVAGYLPLYLLGRGWETAGADGALAVFYVVSTSCVIPLSVISDRIGSRKAILIPAAVAMAVIALLPLASGTAVWVLVALAGTTFDTFISISTTMLMEREDIGPDVSGLALGILFTISQLGSFLSPPLGNSFASISPGTPFFFWSGLSLLSLLILLMIREKTGKRTIAMPVGGER